MSMTTEYFEIEAGRLVRIQLSGFPPVAGVWALTGAEADKWSRYAGRNYPHGEQ
jgi:hypothetical protein